MERLFSQYPGIDWLIDRLVRSAVAGKKRTVFNERELFGATRLSYFQTECDGFSWSYYFALKPDPSAEYHPNPIEAIMIRHFVLWENSKQFTPLMSGSQVIGLVCWTLLPFKLFWLLVKSGPSVMTHDISNEFFFLFFGTLYTALILTSPVNASFVPFFYTEWNGKEYEMNFI